MKLDSAARKFKRVPVSVTDCFVLANDAFMRRTEQGAHVSQSFLELDRMPEVTHLRRALSQLTQRHPILAGKLKRDWKTWLPYWEVPSCENLPPLSLGLWRESDVDRDDCHLIKNTEEHLQQTVYKEFVYHKSHPFHARMDIVARNDGSALIAFTWSHRLFDGKGAELLLAEIGRLCTGDDTSWSGKQPDHPEKTIKETIAKTKPAIIRFDEFAKLGVHSLGGPRPRPGKCRYHVITLSETESARVNRRAAETTGPLFPLPYYLACAARAHGEVFRMRGKEPVAQIASVPIQLRKRGARGPLFFNQVTILFFCTLREDLPSLAATAAALKKQFAEMTRDRLDESFTAVLELMRRVPGRIFMKIVRWQFKGELNSFYHSHTGAFAPEMTTFAGAHIINAWHLPCLGSPPGTGIFFNERNGKLNIVLSWRDGCLTDDERRTMVARLMDDLLGNQENAG
ncbi:MAG TPA: hypothetical protein VIT21_07125 [Chthoniobacterales bacterium]